MAVWQWRLLLMYSVLASMAVTGGVRADRSTAIAQLNDKYGTTAGYFIFNFYPYLGNPQALERKLQTMRANGQLQSLCQYLRGQPTRCERSTSSTDQQETVIVVAYLNTVCCTAAHKDCGLYKPRAKIVGGHQSAAGRYPWVAMLLSSGSLQCGCVIVDHLHVLTAAHCLDRKVVDNRLTSRTLEVLAGHISRSPDTVEHGAQRVPVSSGIRHHNYDSMYLLNDIAVLRLAQPLVFHSNVSSICLPSPSARLPPTCTVAGWGSLAYFRMDPAVLQEVDLHTYSGKECEEVFQSTTSYNISRYLSDGVMCAANGTFGGQDSCRGDSGSSLMCVQTDPSGGLYYSLFGIVSSGFGCGNRGQPGFYTYVPYYIDWICTTIAHLTNQAVGRG